ncbi:MAG: hypothetical protein WDA22_02655 [Bacteroidota bacterium]
MKRQLTPKPKKDNVLKYEKPLKLDMSFEEAINRIVRVDPKELQTK